MSDLLGRVGRWLSRITSAAWCDECERGWSGRMNGSYWHAETCSYSRADYPGRADDE